MDQQILCMTDRIKCRACHNVHEIRGLIPRDGYTITFCDGGGVFQQILYFCPCGDSIVKVYDSGNGKLILAKFQAEVVKPNTS